MSDDFNCPVCGYHKKYLKYTKTAFGKTFQIFSCGNCGLGFTAPVPCKNDLICYYKEYYTEKESCRISGLKEKLKIKLYQGMIVKNKILRVICSLIIKNTMQIVLPPPLENKRVLDVGCGWGRLLDYFKMQGYETYGIEPGPLAAQSARKRGHNVYCGEMLDFKFANDYFGAIVFCHSLEHIHNPIETLNEVYRILAPGGILVIEVPNFVCADAVFFGNIWEPLQIPFHLYHWTPHSLLLLLSKIGYKIKSIRYKLPTIQDYKVNYNNLKAQGKIPLIRVIWHVLLTYLLGYLRIKKHYYGHFMAVYATK